jgi:hypothetical protein
MSSSAGHRHYHRYLMARNIDYRTGKRTQDQINQLIGYIVDDKMSITAA